MLRAEVYAHAMRASQNRQWEVFQAADLWLYTKVPLTLKNKEEIQAPEIQTSICGRSYARWLRLPMSAW